MAIAPAETSPSPEHVTASEATGARPKGVFPPARKLSDDQERELTRLYGEGGTPIADIARTFGLSEVSVGRIARRNGAASRRQRATRVPGSAAATAAPTARTRGGRRASSAAEPGSAEQAGKSSRGRQRRAATSEPRATPRRHRGAASSGEVTRPAPPATSPGPSSTRETRSGGARRRFRIRFLGETVVDAKDILDAIGQAEALGATDITSIAREDA